MPVPTPYQAVILVGPPGVTFPGSCNCACEAAPVAVLRIGTSRCTQAIRLCALHAQALRDELAAFMAARARTRFKRRGPKVGPA